MSIWVAVVLLWFLVIAYGLDWALERLLVSRQRDTSTLDPGSDWQWPERPPGRQ